MSRFVDVDGRLINTDYIICVEERAYCTAIIFSDGSEILTRKNHDEIFNLIQGVDHIISLTPIREGEDKDGDYCYEYLAMLGDGTLKHIVLTNDDLNQCDTFYLEGGKMDCY